MNFEQLKIKKEFVDKLKKMYIESPTPVQEKSIPIVSSGRNLIVKAQTGTGKTLAFLLPLLSELEENKNIQAMILVPTRELADQITKVGKQLTSGTNLKINSVFGGRRIDEQIEKLHQNSNIIVGTPGRILDHLRRGTINLKYLKRVIIDEADQMLAYGFIDDIYLIHSKIPANQQILLFSATIQDNVQKLINDIIPNAQYIEINPEEVVVSQIKQLVLHTTEERRMDSLLFALETYNPFMAIIFAKSKQRAKSLYEDLVQRGITSVELLHGELSQSKRERIIKDFRNLKFQILVSTDISARGIDVKGITHIFNYDVPRETEYYVHRIGRTGRMGEDGIAITLMDDSESRYLKKIEKYAKISIPAIFDRSDYERARIDIEKMKNCQVQETKQRTIRKRSVQGSKKTPRKKTEPTRRKK